MGIIWCSVVYTQDLYGSLFESLHLDQAVEYLAVEFGGEICKLTGSILTEADVFLSFDTSATVDAALRIIELYKKIQCSERSRRHQDQCYLRRNLSCTHSRIEPWNQRPHHHCVWTCLSNRRSRSWRDLHRALCWPNQRLAQGQ